MANELCKQLYVKFANYILKIIYAFFSPFWSIEMMKEGRTEILVIEHKIQNPLITTW